MKLATRMDRLGTETAFEVLARAKQLEAKGREIVHLEIGEPDFDTPRHIIDAAQKAMDDGWTHYVPAAGIPLLKQAVADYIGRTRNLDVDPDEVVVVPGGKPIMFFALLALINQGDEVIYPNPGFPIYESMINFIGAMAVPIPLRMENEFSFDVDEFESLLTDKTKMVILNSPQNPTGGVLSKADLERIADILRDRDLMILSDEIYSEIIYEGKHESITQFPGIKEKTIILDGFSKTFAMTGWRLGFGVMPKDLASQITKLAINATSCTTAFNQVAGAAALNGPWDAIEQMVAEFKRRRDVIVDGLNDIPGFECLKPRGAFYVVPRITGTGMSAKDLEGGLLNEAGVANLAGTAFGAHGEGFLRFSYANSVENIEKALGWIKGYVEKHAG